MREIKFRAWDGSSMDYDIAVGAHTKDTGIFNTCVQIDDGDCWYYHEPPMAVMQFTGLHDKNGKEIYEGDVVKKVAHNLSKEFLYVIAWKNKWACFIAAIAKYTEGYLAHYPSLESGEEFAHHTTPTMEVIGNIYENPELLKEGI